MATFTALGATELSELAERFGLGALHEHRSIAAGTINSNFDVVTETGRYFLRVNEGKTEADVAWEAQLVSALAAAGIATPPPVTTRDGAAYARWRDRWISVFAWRDGGHLGAEQVTPHHADQFGAALAALHVAGLALPPSWRRPSIYDHDHLVARLQRFGTDPALAHATNVIREELALAGAAAAIRERATHGIIHGDLFRDNVLWQADRITAILDFEQASGGSLAYDLAVCINDWCWTGAPRVDLATALVAGYQRVRPLGAADREALPHEIRAAAARFTITRITDVYLAGVDNPDKDFRAFLARCEAWQGPPLGQLTGSV